jgi:hypothetical protein
VNLDVGREVRVDFRLRLAGLWPVKGQTMSGITGRSTGASITLTPLGRDPNLSRYRASSPATGPNAGEFAMSNIPPGHYILTAKSGSADREITVTQRIELRPLLSVPLPGYVASLSLHPPVSLAGRLYVELSTATDLSAATVQLIAVDSDFPSPQSSLARRDGQFAVPGVSPGEYLLDMSNLPEDLYLKAARYGTEDALAKPLEVKSRTAASPLQILLGTDGGRLSVQSEPGAYVVLVPDVARRGRREQYRTATADEDGQTLLRGIPPGNYKVFAWKNPEPNAYLNADYVQGYEGLGLGTPVVIRPGDNPSVSIPVIPR